MTFEEIQAEVFQLHREAMRAAFALAKATRLRELRGERNVKAFDNRGLHPYSTEWGRIFALESLGMGLSAERQLDDGSIITPSSMRRDAEREACLQFEEQVALALGVKQGWITEQEAEALRLYK